MAVDRSYGSSSSNPSPDFVGDDERWFRLTETIEQLAGTRSQDEVIEVLRGTARAIVGAQGIAIVLRDHDQCYYVAEDAAEPLWQGQRFPASTCVSGWAMLNGQTAVIADIEADPRVPLEAYRKTFVRSLVMVPIGDKPFAAIGAYWSQIRVPRKQEIAKLEALARSAATAMENGRLIAELTRVNRELEQRIAELLAARGA
ncbi:hypothetical protein ACFB49_03800 [Sphingomonas sp. DBB INV C78]|uniref:GAF domain-containing protein n=1 Tax=Sphingomonas sp. DBB INV C78 TaxID=3349434 RepID=UPI0036D2A138